MVDHIIKRIHEVWMPRTLKNNVWLLKCFFGQDVFDPVCKGPALWYLGISDELYFFSETWWFHGIKSILPFSKLILNTWHGGHFRKPGMANTRLIPEKNQFSFEMVQRRPGEPKRIPNGQLQLGWPFWTTLERWEACHFWPFLVQNGPFFNHPQSWTLDPKLKRRLITRSPMFGLLVEPQNIPFGT